MGGKTFLENVLIWLDSSLESVCVCVCVKLWVHWGASSGWGEYILGGMHGGRVQVSEEVVGMISD